MLQKSPLVLLVIFVLIITAFSQDRVKELVVNGGCNYYGESLGSKIYTFESEEAAIAAVDKILIPTGLVRNFNIRVADVPNAAAIIYGEDRYILYNQAFMRRVKSQTNTDWAAISIMAHELGHHLNGHTLTRGGSRPPTELEADSFSGFVLYKMGATLEEAQAAMNAFGSETGSDTHPPKRSRLAAIEAGWTKAKNQDKTPPISSKQLVIETPSNSAMVGISSVVRGKTPYPQLKHYLVVVSLQAKRYYIQQPVRVQSDGTWEGFAAFGTQIYGVGDQWSIQIMATATSLSVGEISDFPKDAVFSDEIVVTRNR